MPRLTPCARLDRTTATVRRAARGAGLACLAALTLAGTPRAASADSSSRVFAQLFVDADAVAAQQHLPLVHETGRASVEGLVLPELRTASFAQPGPGPEPVAPPPVDEDTGIGGFIRGTASDIAAFPRRRSTWTILAIGAGAAGLAHPIDDSFNARLVGSSFVSDVFAPGEWVGNPFVQVGAAAGVWIAGRYIVPRFSDVGRDNKVSHLGLDLLRAVAVSQAFTHAIKITAQRDRPTGKCCSFPSGHAATTFATASVLERHLGYRAALPTLLVAGYVAASRLHDDVHYASDVLFGAALGIATGWTVVGRHGRSNYAFVPVPIRGGAMVAFIRQPRSAPGDDEPRRRRATAP